MMGKHEEIINLLKSHFSQRRYQVGEPLTIPLNVPSYGWEEVAEVLDSLLSQRVTMGEKLRQFERVFAEYIGVKHAVMVNSGSSANLIALSVLAHPGLERRIQPGDEIVVPAVPWSTTVFPVIQIGAIPVFVDIDLETYNISIAALKKAITKKTKAIIVVHLLGNPADMEAIMELAQDHNLFVIEDACEAHGAELNGRKVGSFGDLATFSFFFSHHISTIEGGMVVTNNDEYADLARSLRAHGWIREMTTRDQLAKQYPEIDSRFLFITAGYNVRPTEIQGAFGIHQMKRLESFIKVRRENARYWSEGLQEHSKYLYVCRERPGTRHVWFGYPILVKPGAPFSRKDLVEFLEKGRIETRPIMAGNMTEQPVMKLYPHRIVGDLANAHLVMRNAFFFGNHHGIGQTERDYILDSIEQFLSRYTLKGGAYE